MRSAGRPAGRIIVGSGFGVRGGFAFGHNPGFRVFLGSRPFFRQRRFFSPFGFAYPYTIYPYYGLGLQSDFVYSGATQQYDDNSERTAALSSDVYRMQAELDQVRQEQALRADQQQYVSPALMQSPRPAHASAAKAEPEAAGPPTVLIFRDGHKDEVRNYAVVGQTLWIFSEQRARKVAISDLDLDASRRANEERGVEFAVYATPAPAS